MSIKKYETHSEKNGLVRGLALLAALAVMLCAVGFSAAESAAGAPGTTLAAWTEEIRPLNGEGFSVYAPDGRLTFLHGTCTKNPVRNMEDAKAVVDAVIGPAGGDSRTHFEPWRMLNDASGNVYYVFQQVYADTTVLGGAVKVITREDGTMTGLTCSVVNELPEEAEAQGITPEEAEALVAEHETEANGAQPEILPGMTRKIVLPVDRELDVESDEARSRFVWAVYMTNPNRAGGASGLPYLAHYVSTAGEYLYSLPTLLPDDAAGNAGYNADYVFEFMEPVNYTGYVDLSDGTEKEISVDIMRDSRTGMYYLGNIEHRIVVADCWEFLYNHGNVVLEYSPDNREWDQTALLSLYNYCRASDYYRAIGWKGGDGENTPIIVLKDFCDQDHRPVNNAAFAGRYYGWQCFLSSSANDFAQCLDICAHEFTHCVTQSVMTYSAYQNDCGAINEAISDIQGNICEMLSGATDDTSWTLGETGSNAVRSMSEPHLYGQPEYSWDLYYLANVKTPTVVNDQGGVHSNSSLLNNIAYRLCADGGMSLEEARNYWFAVDCAMVPGTDYAQLRELLPFVLETTGLEQYLGALKTAVEATRLGEHAMPEQPAEDRALLTLNLPDREPFNDGNWMLSVFSVNLDRLSSLIGQLKDGNGDDLPRFLKDPDLLNRELTKAERDELSQWIKDNLQDLFYQGTGSAGQDGHTVHMMTKPGQAFPCLLNLKLKPNSDQVEEAHILIFWKGGWVDGGALIPDPADSGAVRELLKGVLREGPQQDILGGLIRLVFRQATLSDLLKEWSCEIRAGEVCELPSEGLDRLSGSADVAFLFQSAQETPVENKMSRPKK